VDMADADADADADACMYVRRWHDE
jgi:hypothetical protein